jgi:hypothetical protein
MKNLLRAALAVALLLPAVSRADDIKVGIIGLDTSHVTAFTKILNDTTNPAHVPGAKVVAAFKGGSNDIESSYSRVEGYTAELQNTYGVEIVSTIEELCTKVDAVLLESVDGRPHLEQVKPVFAAGKPVFIDKPVAGSLKDAIEIYKLGKQHNVKWFSSSSYRYYPTMVALMQEDVGKVYGAISYGPAHLEEHHPDLYWYGVHPVESLYTALGTGCVSVVRTSTPSTDVVTGVWADGKVGTLRGLRDQATPHQVILFGEKKVALQQEGPSDYAPLVAEIVKFFQTGVVPVDPKITVEMFAFMEAADESKRRGGVPVTLEEVLNANGGPID